MPLTNEPNMNHHFVQHFLQPGDYVRTKFTCTAPVGAPCRVACELCEGECREVCQCECLNEPRTPKMVDYGECLQLLWLTENAPEECFTGEEQPVRGPDPQPIVLKYNGYDGDNYGWDYA